MKAIWPFRHFGLKVLALGLALMLWIIVAGEETVERGLRVPLELQQFPTGLEMLGEAPSLVDVRVRGSAGSLSRLGPGDVVAVIDLRAVRPGRRLFQLTPEQVRSPFGVQVVQVMPSSITLTFDLSASKPVPVVPAVEGSPAPGFVVGETTAVPSTVEVVGPESAVEQATEALTEPVDVSGATEDVTDTVSIGFQDPSLRMRTPRLATVTVEVRPGPVERVFAGRPIHLRGVSRNLAAQVTPTSVQVIVRGSRESLDRLAPDRVTAYVDLAGLGAGDYVLGVRAEASGGAGIARIDPATVQVRITSVKD